MAVQKSRKARSRRDMRRSQIKLRKPQLAIDPTSGENHRRHHMTTQGFYRGKQVLVNDKPDADQDDVSQ